MRDPNGPLLGLSQDFILGLTEEDQDRLGGEDEDVVRDRKEAEETISRLKEAKRIADEALWKTRRVQHT